MDLQALNDETVKMFAGFYAVTVLAVFLVLQRHILCLCLEIRSHGTGFYQFSKDSNLREEQMDMLNRLREQVRRWQSERQYMINWRGNSLMTLQGVSF